MSDAKNETLHRPNALSAYDEARIEQVKREHEMSVRSTALEAAIRCLGAGASDWQSTVKAARDILGFLRDG